MCQVSVGQQKAMNGVSYGGSHGRKERHEREEDRKTQSYKCVKTIQFERTQLTVLNHFRVSFPEAGATCPFPNPDSTQMWRRPQRIKAWHRPPTTHLSRVIRPVLPQNPTLLNCEDVLGDWLVKLPDSISVA